MAEVLETLATRRSRRSTAGNRMEAALAEMALEDSNKDKDADDDVEFVNDKVEEDVFESDFASTDEEAENQEDLDAGEKAIHEEEKSTRKAARTRFEKHTAAAHAKHKATFNPQAIAPPVKPKPVVKLVETRNNEFASTSGEVIASPRRAGQKRKSQRMHTVRNTTETVSRLKETEEKKASAPKKYKPTTRIYSQSELIRWALDNEEGNIKEHKNYLKNEEEKRKKARVIKMPAVEGPLLRWVSKIEEEKFKVQVDVTPPPPPPPPPQPVTNPTFSAYTNYYGAYNYYANYLSQLITTSAAAGNTPATATTTTATAAVGNTATTTGTATAAVGKTVATTPTTITTSQTTVSPNDKPQTEGKPMTQVASSASPVVQPTAPTSTSTSTPTTTTQPIVQTNTTVSSSTPPSIQTLSFASTPIPATPVTQPTNQAFSTFRVNAPTTSTVPTTYPTYNYYTPTSTNTNISASTFPITYPRPATTTTASVPTQPVQRQYVEEERTEKVTKNYVVHELGQREGIGKPPWKEMMKSMFGDHVKWDEVRVLSGKGRPMSRVKQRCPITGQVAPYLDPRTGVPFSNVEAYKILSEVLDHGYIWSPELGCYLTRDENTEMQDVI